jgi:hypothetical protein
MSTGPDASEAVPHNTPSVPTSPWIMPGDYTVRLIAGTETQSQPLKVIMDPRVKTPTADLEQQFTVSKSMYDDMLKATVAIHEITVLRDQMKSQSAALPGTDAQALKAKLDAIAGSDQGGFRRGGGGGPATLTSVRLQLSRLEHSVQNADAAPTNAQIEAAQMASKQLPDLLQKWDAVKKTDLKAMNEQLRLKHLRLLSLDTHKIDHDVEDQIELGDDQ